MLFEPKAWVEHAKARSNNPRTGIFIGRTITRLKQSAKSESTNLESIRIEDPVMISAHADEFTDKNHLCPRHHRASACSRDLPRTRANGERSDPISHRRSGS